MIYVRVLHELGGLLAASEVAWDDNPVSATMLVDVLTHLNKNEVTGEEAISIKWLNSEADTS